MPDLLFLRVPEAKAGKNRLHLDLRPEDQDAEVARLEALGASRTDVGQGDDVALGGDGRPGGQRVLRAARVHARGVRRDRGDPRGSPALSAVQRPIRRTNPRSARDSVTCGVLQRPTK